MVLQLKEKSFSKLVINTEILRNVILLGKKIKPLNINI
jgi:hypothetical protein